MALYRPGAFLSLWSRNIGSAWPELYPGAVSLEVYEFLDRVDHKTENLFHEQRRHWDDREFDEYIITTEGVGAYGEAPEKYLCRVETLHELMAVLDTCTEA